MAHRPWFGVIMAVSVWLSCAWTFAQSDERDELPARIESGAVFVNGRYLPPPYEVRIENGQLLLNDQLLDSERVGAAFPANRRGEPGSRDGAAPQNEGRQPKRDRAADAATFAPNRADDSTAVRAAAAPQAVDVQASCDRLRKALLADRKFLYWDDADARLMSWDAGDALFWVLLNDKTTSREKLQRLRDLNVRGVEPEQWLTLVERFDPPPELQAAYQQPGGDTSIATRYYQHRQSMLYFITVGGLGLSVFALGTLLSYRPHEKLAWSATNLQDDAMKLVVRSVGLLMVLGLLDLVATISSAQTVGFYEVNPLGSAVLQHPELLIAFKVSATLASAVILFALRRYHGAQVAAWWLALFCTVLTLRWVTFNSMMLA